MREILKGSLVIFLFKIIGAFSLFALYILISRYYGAETFGVFNLIFALMLTFSVLTRVGLDTYLLRVVSSLKDDKEEIALFLKRVFTILLFSSLFVSLLIYAFSNYIDEYLFKSIDAKAYIIGLAFITLPYTFFNVLPELFRGFEDIRRYAFFRNFSQNFTIVLLVSLSIFGSFNYDPIYILYFSIVLIAISIVVTAYIFLKKQKINLLIKGRYNKKILKYSYPMFLASSIMFIMGYVDSFMISYYLDEYHVGIYNACINLSMLITFIPMAIGGFISPKVSLAYSNNEFDKIKNIFKNSFIIILIVTLPIFLILYLYADSFLALFGADFRIATTTLLLTNIAFLSEALCGPVGFIMNMTDNQHLFMKILIISLLINIVFNALLIPIYGINGAATAMILSMFFWTIGSLIALKRKRII